MRAVYGPSLKQGRSGGYGLYTARSHGPPRRACEARPAANEDGPLGPPGSASTDQHREADHACECAANENSGTFGPRRIQ